MELTKMAEEVKQDLSLSKLADVVMEICKEMDRFSTFAKPKIKESEIEPFPELKPEIKKKKKNV